MGFQWKKASLGVVRDTVSGQRWDKEDKMLHQKWFQFIVRYLLDNLIPFFPTKIGQYRKFENWTISFIFCHTIILYDTLLLFVAKISGIKNSPRALLCYTEADRYFPSSSHWGRTISEETFLFSSVFKWIFIIDEEGSSQMILPMPNLERAY